MAETLRFDILGDASSASRAFRETATGSALAARGAKQLADSLNLQSKSAQVSAGATLALAKSDKTLRDAEALLAGTVDEATNKIQAQGRAAEDAAVKTRLVAGGASDAASAFGSLGTPIGAAVAAGVALSPVIATLGLGLGGLGLAAYTASKNTDEMGKILGPLKSSVAGFSQSLQPEVLTAFGEASVIAQHGLKDIQPIAAATGKALDSVLGRVDAEFQSSQWQNFFKQMAQQAGPDMQLLGSLIVDLTNDLPQLLTQLQPVAQGLLILSDDAAKAASALTLLSPLANVQSAAMEGSAVATKAAAGQQENFGEKLLGWIGTGGIAVGHVIGLGAAMDDAGPAAKTLGKNTAAAAAATSLLALSAKAATPPTDAQNAALYVTNQNAKGAAASVDTLNSAWSAFLGLSTSLVTAQIGVEGGLKTLTADAKAAGASFTGTNAASQQLQTDFESNLVPGLQNVLNGMRKAGAGTHDLATVLATDLKPAADRGALANKALEQQIFDMAVQAGYTGPNKLRPLKSWIDSNAGSAQNAANKVNQFGAALARLPKSESLKVIMQGRGTYAIVNSTTGVPYPVRAAAAGAYITSGTGPTSDDVPARLSKGELVVPAKMVSAGAVDHLRGRIPGFAAGGYVGSWNLTPAFVQGMYGDFQRAVTGGTSQALSAGIAGALKAGIAQATSAISFGSGPAAYGSAAAAQSFARSILPGGWSWPALLALWNQESGWNPYAVNPSSGAYGIPQALGKGHPYALGDYANQVRWGISYIAGRYGNSQNAWAHETAFNWYDKGGLLKPGLTLALNTSGRAEQVIPAGGSAGGHVNLTVNINAPVGSQGELDMWLTRSLNRLSRTGRLTQAVRTASR